MRREGDDKVGRAMGAMAGPRPNGRCVHYTHGASTSIDIALARVTAVKAESGGSPGTPGDPLASCSYTGNGRIVQEHHGHPGVKLTYAASGFGSKGGAYAPGSRLPGHYGRVGRFKLVAW